VYVTLLRAGEVLNLIINGTIVQRLNTGSFTAQLLGIVVDSVDCLYGAGNEGTCWMNSLGRICLLRSIPGSRRAREHLWVADCDNARVVVSLPPAFPYVLSTY
jgi:hypothetical protein